MNNTKQEFPDMGWLEPEYMDLNEYGELYLESIKNNPQATELDEIPGAEGRFGLDPSNPIPIHGIPNARIYLDNLYYNGRPLFHQRIGSLQIPEINLPIDEYELYDLEEKFICNVFISPYHRKCSAKSPEGFLTKSDYFKKILGIESGQK